MLKLLGPIMDSQGNLTQLAFSKGKNQVCRLLAVPPLYEIDS